MKSILFLIPNLGGGGAERVLVNMVNNLDKNKYDITVQTLFDVGVNKQFLHKDVKYIGGFSHVFRGNIHLLKCFSPKFLYQIIVKKRYDLVVSYLEGPTARIVSGCPFTDSKKISWIHGEKCTAKRFAESFRSIQEAVSCYSKYDKTICVANTVREDFEKFVNTDCAVLYNLNEDCQIHEMGKEPITDIQFSSEVNLISVGKLTETKGFDRLLHVHQRLLKQGIRHHIYIVGSGSEEAILRREASNLGVFDTFHLIGFKVNPYKYVAKADIFICSSRREGFSTAVTEALYLGVPVVSTCCSGAKELLGSNNEFGIVTENSEEGIYQGLKQMLTDKQLREHYREMSVCRGQTFSKEQTLQRIEDLFDSI